MSEERTFQTSQPSSSITRRMATVRSRSRQNRFLYSHEQAALEMRTYMRNEMRITSWIVFKCLFVTLSLGAVAYVVTDALGRRYGGLLLNSDGVLSNADIKRQQAQKDQLDTLLETRLPPLLEQLEKNKQEREERKRIRDEQLKRLRAKIHSWTGF